MSSPFGPKALDYGSNFTATTLATATTQPVCNHVSGKIIVILGSAIAAATLSSTYLQAPGAGTFKILNNRVASNSVVSVNLVGAWSDHTRGTACSYVNLGVVGAQQGTDGQFWVQVLNWDGTNAAKVVELNFFVHNPSMI